MIYTLGKTVAYSEYIERYGSIEKSGRKKDFQGGSVWKTYREASRHCPEDYSVYGVDADWDKDTAKSWNKQASWRDLLKDATIIELDNKEK